MRFIFVVLLLCHFVHGFNLSAQDSVPDFTQGETIPNGHTHDWNLGPTGARGWIYSNKMETREARQILVTTVAAGSPAEKILSPDDVILGVSGNRFSYDPRVEFGKAIGEAEASDGILKLIRWRQGDTETVEIQLQQLGSYSSTAPFNCPKSQKIFLKGCEALAAKMRNQTRPGNGIVRAYNTLALLSSGDRKYMPVIKKQIKWASEYSDVSGRSLCCWYYGPVNLLMAEYVLATGDQSYLPQLKRITMEIVNGQSGVGSWGHRFARPDRRLNGYGMMNAPGLPMTTSLVMARAAGVKDRKLDEAIRKSERLMRFYVGTGCIPYGDHGPWIQTHDDNGKNGIAAVMFNLLNDPEAASYFSKMSVASHGSERENGHTGNFFNMLWALPGVAISGPNATGAWMKEFGWYYDLARKWDGTFQHQGPAQPKSDSYRNWDATGAYLLAYGQAYRKIYLTGKKQNVIQPVDPQVAEQLVADGRGYDNRERKLGYLNRSVPQLFENLESWSPVVRERAAMALAKKNEYVDEKLKKMLSSSNLHAQLGACQAIKHLGPRAAETVPHLRNLLNSDQIWLRIQAAEALAGVGDAARVTIPDLLKLLVTSDPKNDPRKMTQRFVCFALFDSRRGLLKRSLKGVDREELYAAVRATLQNEDGKARGAVSKIYRRLTFGEIQALLPAILDSTAVSAPSGMMFADGVRLNGLDVLAEHNVEEGMQLCLDVIEYDRWGGGKRLRPCLESLRKYQGAAKPLLPQLKKFQRDVEKVMSRKRRMSDGDKQQLEAIELTIKAISEAKATPKLIKISE